MKLLFATKDQRDLGRTRPSGSLGPGLCRRNARLTHRAPGRALRNPAAPRELLGGSEAGGPVPTRVARAQGARRRGLPGPSVGPARCGASPAPEAAAASARPAPRRRAHARFLCEVSESFCVPPSKGDDSLPPEAGAASAGHAVGLLPAAGGGGSSPRGRTLPRRRRRPPVSLGTRVRVVDAHPQAITLCTLSLPSWY